MQHSHTTASVGVEFPGIFQPSKEVLGQVYPMETAPCTVLRRSQHDRVEGYLACRLRVADGAPAQLIQRSRHRNL